MSPEQIANAIEKQVRDIGEKQELSDIDTADLLIAVLRSHLIKSLQEPDYLQSLIIRFTP